MKDKLVIEQPLLELEIFWKNTVSTGEKMIKSMCAVAFGMVLFSVAMADNVYAAHAAFPFAAGEIYQRSLNLDGVTGLLSTTIGTWCGHVGIVTGIESGGYADVIPKTQICIVELQVDSSYTLQNVLANEAKFEIVTWSLEDAEINGAPSAASSYGKDNIADDIRKSVCVNATGAVGVLGTYVVLTSPERRKNFPTESRCDGFVEYIYESSGQGLFPNDREHYDWGTPVDYVNPAYTGLSTYEKRIPYIYAVSPSTFESVAVGGDNNLSDFIVRLGESCYGSGIAAWRLRHYDWNGTLITENMVEFANADAMGAIKIPVFRCEHWYTEDDIPIVAADGKYILTIWDGGGNSNCDNPLIFAVQKRDVLSGMVTNSSTGKGAAGVHVEIYSNTGVRFQGIDMPLYALDWDGNTGWGKSSGFFSTAQGDVSADASRFPTGSYHVVISSSTKTKSYDFTFNARSPIREPFSF